MPFATSPTAIHQKEVGNYLPLVQIRMALDMIKEHIDKGNRIYVISRFKREVPKIADYLRETMRVPVFFLHGDMADSKEHSKRHRLGPNSVRTPEHRIVMMQDFRKNCPAIMVATNLVGSGLDIPMADFIIITDSHTFTPAEKEQLIGRVGRRERASDALLLEGDTAEKEREIKSQVKFSTKVMGNGKIRYSFSPHGMRRGR
jgi:RecG-like helicase